MKKNIIEQVLFSGYRLLMAVVCMGISYTSLAQAPCCLTDRLIINTGYDPVTNAAVGAGGTDPHWNVCAIDAALAADITATGVPVAPGSDANVVAPIIGWTGFPGGAGGTGSWISCVNPAAYHQTTLQNYNWTVCREFNLQCAAEVTFNLNLTADNWVMAADVDGVPIALPLTPYCCAYLFGGVGINVYGGDPSVFNALAPFTMTLTAGPHVISFHLRNDNYIGVPPADWNNIGFALHGTISTPTPSIVPEQVTPCIPTNCPVIGGEVCVGATITLVPVVSGGTWTSTDIGIATVHPVTGVVTGVAGGVVNIEYDPGAGIGCVVITTVTVNPLPVLTAVGDRKICMNEAGEIIRTSIPGGTWSSSAPSVGAIVGPVTILGVETIAVTPGSPGVTTITNTSPKGCVAITTVTVYALPTITGTLSVCVGQTTALTGSPTGGTWQAAVIPLGVLSISSGGVVTGLGTGMKYVAYTAPASANKCIALAHVTVNATPKLPRIRICEGSYFDITGLSGTWQSSDEWVATVTAVSPSIERIDGVHAGTSIITFTSSIGCVATTVVTVDPVPVITGPTTLCGVAGSVSLTFSPTGGGWSTSSTATITGTGPGTVDVTGLSVGTNVLTYTLKPSGCSTLHTITVFRRPRVSIMSEGGGLHETCRPAMISLSGSPAGGVWGTTNPAIATVDIYGVVTPIAPGTVDITYSYTDPVTGCSGTATHWLTVLPDVTVTPTTPILCLFGSPVTLTGTPSGGTWSDLTYAFGNIDPGTGVVTGFYPGTFYVRYEVPGYCPATDTVEIVGAPFPCGYFFVPSGGFEIPGPPGATAIYEWGSVSGPYGIDTVTLTGYTLGGSFPVPHFTGCCNEDSWIRVVSVSYLSCVWDYCDTLFGMVGYKGVSGIDDAIRTGEVIENISMVPNPNSGQFSIKGIVNTVADDKDVKLEVVNMVGQAIYSATSQVDNNSMDKTIRLPDNIPNGIYFVKVRYKNVTKTIQFTVER